MSNTRALARDINEKFFVNECFCHQALVQPNIHGVSFLSTNNNEVWAVVEAISCVLSALFSILVSTNTRQCGSNPSYFPHFWCAVYYSYNYTSYISVSSTNDLMISEELTWPECVCCFVDVKKAVDTVSRSELSKTNRDHNAVRLQNSWIFGLFGLVFHCDLHQ